MSAKATYTWHNAERTILIVEVPPFETWAQAEAIVQEQVAWMATVRHAVHTIFHVQGDFMVPPGALQALNRLLRLTHPNEDLVIFINLPAPLPMMIHMTNRLYRIYQRQDKYSYFHTLEQALAFIADYEAHAERYSASGA